MIETLKTLCALNGVSGTEDEVRTYIENRVRPYADGIETDVMGNLIVFKKGRKTPSQKIMLSAHMDEVGVIVTEITEDGYIRFACVGGIDRRVIMGKTVFIGKNHVCGVVGNKAIHLVKAKERDIIPPLDEMYIDIGAKNAEEAKKLVSPGDTGAFSGRIFEFGDGFLRAKAIDDRVGCAVLIKLIESDLPVDCHFVFTVQEEVGTRGVFGAAFRLEPDIALVVEGTTAADMPSVQPNKRICSLGKGAVIPFMDRGTIYDRELYSMLSEVAEKNGVKWQTKTYIAGGTDASAVQRSRGGVKAAGIAVPIRNIHSPACVASLSDCEAVFKLAKLFLETVGERF